MTSTDQQQDATTGANHAQAASDFIDQELGGMYDAGELLGQGTPDDELGETMVRIVRSQGGYRFAKHVNQEAAGIWASVAIQDAGGQFTGVMRAFYPWAHIARVEQIIGA